jgi:peptidyl-prolyl cis-trans isomerase C
MKRALFGYTAGIFGAGIMAITLNAGNAMAATGDASTPGTAMSKTVAPKDPVVATVNGYKIHLSDLAKAAQSLPPQLQQAPPQELYPVLLNRLVDERALLVKARTSGIAKNPAVDKAMHEAADRALESAYLRSEVKPALNDAAVKAYYDKHYTTDKQPEQVKARQILVKTQPEAEKIIGQLNKGAKFSDLAIKDSIDPGAKNGGELGWFTKDEMVKPFADAAFALQPGTYTKTPIQSQFGWHIIKSQGKRQKPVPAFDDVKDKIRQTMTDQAITHALESARTGLKIVLFNPDGSPAAAPSATAPGTAPAKN